MRIAIIGAGRVGTSLRTALRAKGHQLTYGVRQPKTAGEPVTNPVTKPVVAAIAGAEHAKDFLRLDPGDARI